MKKKFISKKIIAVLLSMCLVLSMTACGGAEETEETTTQEEEVVEEVVEEEVAEEEPVEETVEEVVEEEVTEEETVEEDADSDATTLEDYLATQDVQSMIDSVQESVGDTMVVNMYAEGNDLIYDYAFTDGTLDDSTLELMGEELIKGLEEQTSVFANIAAQMNKEINADDCRVIVRYTYEGELLAELAFEEGDEAPVEEETDTEETTEATVDVDSLEAYFETADGQAMIEAAKSSAGEGMNIDVFAEGNDLIYTYTYDDGMIDSSMIDSVSEQLVSAMESQASVFENIASQMNALIGADDCRVLVRYYYEEELLAEGTFESAE